MLIDFARLLGPGHTTAKMTATATFTVTLTKREVTVTLLRVL